MINVQPTRNETLERQFKSENQILELKVKSERGLRLSTEEQLNQVYVYYIIKGKSCSLEHKKEQKVSTPLHNIIVTFEVILFLMKYMRFQIVGIHFSFDKIRFKK